MLKVLEINLEKYIKERISEDLDKYLVVSEVCNGEVRNLWKLKDYFVELVNKTSIERLVGGDDNAQPLVLLEVEELKERICELLIELRNGCLTGGYNLSRRVNNFFEDGKNLEWLFNWESILGKVEAQLDGNDVIVNLVDKKTLSEFIFVQLVNLYEGKYSTVDEVVFKVGYAGWGLTPNSHSFQVDKLKGVKWFISLVKSLKDGIGNSNIDNWWNVEVEYKDMELGITPNSVNKLTEKLETLTDLLLLLGNNIREIGSRRIYSQPLYEKLVSAYIKVVSCFVSWISTCVLDYKLELGVSYPIWYRLGFWHKDKKYSYLMEIVNEIIGWLESKVKNVAINYVSNLIGGWGLTLPTSIKIEDDLIEKSVIEWKGQLVKQLTQIVDSKLMNMEWDTPNPKEFSVFWKLVGVNPKALSDVINALPKVGGIPYLDKVFTLLTHSKTITVSVPFTYLIELETTLPNYKHLFITILDNHIRNKPNDVILLGFKDVVNSLCNTEGWGYAQLLANLYFGKQYTIHFRVGDTPNLEKIPVNIKFKVGDTEPQPLVELDKVKQTLSQIDLRLGVSITHS